MVTVSTAAATAAAAAAAELPLKGLLALNSRHLAPSTVIILDMGILGFFLAIRGLQGGGEGEPCVSSTVLCVWSSPKRQECLPAGVSWGGSRNQSFLKQIYLRGAHLNLLRGLPSLKYLLCSERLVVQAEIH